MELLRLEALQETAILTKNLVNVVPCDVEKGLADKGDGIIRQEWVRKTIVLLSDL